jgi:hypothetical protein
MSSDGGKVKRGRKTKKEMNEIKENKENKEKEKLMAETIFFQNNDEEKEKEKGKGNVKNENMNEIVNEIVEENAEENDGKVENAIDELLVNKGAKKRGRKPKGGKIIQQLLPANMNKEPKPSVILHLKCSVKDLQKQLFTDMEPYSFNKNDLGFEMLNELGDNDTTPIYNLGLHVGNNNANNDSVFKGTVENDEEYNEVDEYDKNAFMKEIWKKLKQLEQKLHLNNVGDKKSACFWCTHDFDNPPVYIPKYYIKDMYHVYGCFCSPECATAFLMEENVDSSTKFERYHLLNHIYSKIYNYTKNIKPAPSPFYMLNKYYGNLTIQEYRSLLKNDRLFLIVDKPLTRILPELHEDNEDFIINNKIIPSNGFQIKKKIQRKIVTKTTILNEKFGMGV